MKNNILSFSKYKAEQALHIQMELSTKKYQYWDRRYYMVEFYLEYLDICGFDKRAIEEINRLELSYSLTKSFNSFSQEAVENHTEWIDNIVEQYIR